ncbi:hypothetical protein TNCV_1946831 [Trichonephila clavipes]|nr:hypothetical protein TNCV_1946831 [Trichonephila clavipes]
MSLPCVSKKETSRPLQPICLGSKNTGITPGVMVLGLISYHHRSTFMANSCKLTEKLYVIVMLNLLHCHLLSPFKEGNFQQDSECPHASVTPKHAALAC